MTNLTPEIIESATDEDKEVMNTEKEKYLLCDDHINKCNSPIMGLFNSKFPEEEPCLMCENKQQAETIERLTELMLVTREQAGLLQEAIIRCDSKQDIKSRVVFIIEMINKKVTEINKLEAGEL